MQNPCYGTRATGAGPESPVLIKKIEEIRAKYGEHCWDHMDKRNKTARLFYGEVVANKLEAEIKIIVRNSK